MRRRRRVAGRPSSWPRVVCRQGCGVSVLMALVMPRESWRPFDPAPVTGDLRAFAYVLVGSQAWRRVDLLEHYVVTRELDEEHARALVDEYQHHLLHTHEGVEE